MIARQNLNPSQVKWNDVRMIIGLSDLKGIQEQVSLEQDGEVTIFEPGIPVENLEPGRGSASDNMLYELFSVGLNAKPAFPTPDSALQEIYPFSVAMRLNSSRGIYVVPAGKTTTASIQSDWTTPSFDGEFLPRPGDQRQGFVAEWRVLDLNRSFGQVIRSDNAPSTRWLLRGLASGLSRRWTSTGRT